MNKELLKDIKEILISIGFVVLSIIVSNAELKTAFFIVCLHDSKYSNFYKSL